MIPNGIVYVAGKWCLILFRYCRYARSIDYIVTGGAGRGDQHGTSIYMMFLKQRALMITIPRVCMTWDGPSASPTVINVPAEN